ncbi:homoserine dehydrogenase [bacterium]|nr:homoserine dehydrogenase [bacterium]
MKIALVGLGTVGREVARLALEEREMIRRRSGADLELVVIVDKDLTPRADLSIPRQVKFTDDLSAAMSDASIAAVVELIGGTGAARDVQLEALRKKKHVVTANKALLAERGAELLKEAAQNGVQLRFEGSVCGGIPIIKSLAESLAGNRIEELYGIINGTANYILTQMVRQGLTFEQALKEAKRLGFAEADPTFDVEGTDTAHKLTLLCRLAFGVDLPFDRLSYEGISKLSPLDLRYAADLGYTIKLLAVAKRRPEGLEARAHPALIPSSHPLAAVSNEFNAVTVVGDRVGEMMFYGRGAGGRATASAVLSDLIDIALGRPSGGLTAYDSGLRIIPKDASVSKWYLRFKVLDRPGVLGQLATVLGSHHISIEACLQKGGPVDGAVPVVMQTFEAKESDLRRAIEGISRMDFIREPTQTIRVETLRSDGTA